jgi:hypothetical protein
MKDPRKASALAALICVGLVLAGCGQSPLAPGETGQGGVTVHSTPPVVTLAGDGTVDYVQAPVESTLTEDVNEDINIVAYPKAERVSVRVAGSRGGAVRAGRFSLKIPPGAFEGDATVTITMPDTTVMVCDLSIAPLSANGFKVPVVLTADLSSTDLPDASTLTMYWYDPSGLTWVNCSAKSRTMGALVTMSLEHFSRYAAGKAGW